MVFYTDAQYWRREADNGDFDQLTADDWDVDVSCYRDKKSGDKDSQDLLQMLVCPLCKVPVKLLDDQSGLKCPSCRRVYPVRDEIPVMLPEEATIQSE